MKSSTKIRLLKKSYTDTIWMAIRYAHGRHTYAPDMVRNSIRTFQQVDPNWVPRADDLVRPPKSEELQGMALRCDYLDDLLSSEDAQNSLGRDYSREKNFWFRLRSFVENVQVRDPMSEEEQEFILLVCDRKTGRISCT